MGGLVKGDVVVLPFPFSDLIRSKRRPDHVFTAHAEIVLYRAGHLRSSKTTEIVERLVTILRQ